MDELDDKLRAMADEYHEPPALDRERVWDKIVARRASRAGREPVAVLDEHRAPRVARRETLLLARRSALAWVTAIAAVLAIEFVLGRGSAPSSDAAPGTSDVAASGGRAAQTNAIAIAAAGHIRQAETYLTLFRASAQGGTPDDAAILSARALLATNRLLATAPGADPRLRQLLLDLELVLVQITQLEGSDRPEDVRMITDGLDQAGTLTRLRSASPRYPASLTTGVS
jgi:hypothetical protein